jgi:hypothetical protein
MHLDNVRIAPLLAAAAGDVSPVANGTGPIPRGAALYMYREVGFTCRYSGRGVARTASFYGSKGHHAHGHWRLARASIVRRCM